MIGANSARDEDRQPDSMRRGGGLEAPAVALRAAYGMLVLSRGTEIGAAVAHQPAGRGLRACARFLGIRHVAESTLLVLRPQPTTMWTVASIDAIHGASMVGLTLLSSRWRRLAALNVVVAAGLGALESACARAADRRSHG